MVFLLDNRGTPIHLGWLCPPPTQETAEEECTNSPMTKVRLCFHDRCFDGTASAALFYRFYRERFDADAEFGFTGMTHRAAQPWEPELFDGDENVIEQHGLPWLRCPVRHPGKEIGRAHV